MKTLKIEVTSGKAECKDLKNKEFRMVETKDGLLVPRDCRYRLDWPKSIKKTDGKVKAGKVTEAPIIDGKEKSK